MKKAQASVEYLMTYGWAILVVLGMVAALAYFGVMRPSMLLPEQCVLGTELLCKDVRVDPSQVNLLIYNSGAFDILIYSISLESCNSTPNDVVRVGNQKLFTRTIMNSFYK